MQLTDYATYDAKTGKWVAKNPSTTRIRYADSSVYVDVNVQEYEQFRDNSLSSGPDIRKSTYATETLRFKGGKLIERDQRELVQTRTGSGGSIIKKNPEVRMRTVYDPDSGQEIKSVDYVFLKDGDGSKYKVRTRQRYYDQLDQATAKKEAKRKAAVLAKEKPLYEVKYKGKKYVTSNQDFKPKAFYDDQAAYEAELLGIPKGTRLGTPSQSQYSVGSLPVSEGFAKKYEQAYNELYPIPSRKRAAIDAGFTNFIGELPVSSGFAAKYKQAGVDAQIETIRAGPYNLPVVETEQSFLLESAKIYGQKTKDFAVDTVLGLGKIGATINPLNSRLRISKENLGDGYYYDQSQGTTNYLGYETPTKLFTDPQAATAAGAVVFSFLPKKLITAGSALYGTYESYQATKKRTPESVANAALGYTPALINTVGERVFTVISREIAYKRAFAKLEKQYGKNSPEVLEIKAAYTRAYKELPRYVEVTRDYNPVHLETLENLPVAVRKDVSKAVAVAIEKNPSTRVIGSSGGFTQTNLKTPPRPFGDVDITKGSDKLVADVVAGVTKAGLKPKVSQRGATIEKGVILDTTTTKTHIVVGAGEFVNISKNALPMTYAQLSKQMDLLDVTPIAFVRTPKGVALLNIRDQFRAKLYASIIEGGRPKDLVDALAYKKGTDFLFKEGKFTGKTTGKTAAFDNVLSSVKNFSFNMETPGFGVLSSKGGSYYPVAAARPSIGSYTPYAAAKYRAGYAGYSPAGAYATNYKPYSAYGANYKAGYSTGYAPLTYAPGYAPKSTGKYPAKYKAPSYSVYGARPYSPAIPTAYPPATPGRYPPSIPGTGYPGRPYKPGTPAGPPNIPVFDFERNDRPRKKKKKNAKKSSKRKLGYTSNIYSSVGDFYGTKTEKITGLPIRGLLKGRGRKK